MLNLDYYPLPESGIVGRVVDQEAVLVLPNAGKIEVLNEVGARIWALSTGAISIAAIIEAVITEYDVDPDQAQVDVLEFINVLVEKGLLRVSAQPISLGGD